MAKKKIDALLAKANRISPKLRERIMGDMREIVKAERAGRALPTYPQIIDYIREEYKVQLSSSAVGDWLQKARRET